jgi:kynurenine formamidase
MTKNWGRWGENDQLGALNLITPEKRAAALQVPTAGQVYSLAQNIQPGGVPMIKDGARGVFMRPVHMMIYDGGDQCCGMPTRGDNYFSAEDMLSMRIHGTATHIDGLAHGWKHGQLFNGYPSSSVNSFGAQQLGIENVQQIVTRGLLFDVARAKGVKHLPAGYAITIGDLQACGAPSVEPGDAILVRTGWYNVFYGDDPEHYHDPRPGVSADAALWLADQDIVLLGCDNTGVEVVPIEYGGSSSSHSSPADAKAGGFGSPVHSSLLRDYGIYLLELLVLEELSAADVVEFLFVLAPLRITGGTGSPVNPLAIA